mmetsp:Transcript_32127/g.109119  ORF Transcript_32127/g.109119 Transcript_32127/m.109119 type:complete len:90 (-) Transcript_32127:301-570(-)
MRDTNNKTELPCTTGTKPDHPGIVTEPDAQTVYEGSDNTKQEREKVEHQLTEENARLRRELEAFDLSFFERIEDLKFNYHQVRMQLEDT